MKNVEYRIAILPVLWRKIWASLVNTSGIARNLVAMVIWQGANYIAPLLTFPHLARTLHPDGFGQLGVYLLIGGWMTVVSDWGTNFTGSREIAQENARSGNIEATFWNIFVLRIFISAVLLLCVVAYLVVMKSDVLHWKLLIASWLMIFGNSLTVSWCLQGWSGWIHLPRRHWLGVFFPCRRLCCLSDIPTRPGLL